MDIIVGGPLKPNGQNVPTRVGEIVSDYSELANIPNPRVGMEVWVASKKEAVRILTLKEATIAGVVVPNAVVDTWEIVPNRAMTTSLANKISEEEQRATLAEGALATKIGEEEQRATEAENALRDKVADLEENYIAKMSELDTEVESLHSEDANLQSNINEIQLDLQSKINELGQEYLKGIEDVNRGITRIDAKAIQIGSFEVESLTNGIGVNFGNIDGTQSVSFEIPAATTERAGVMSAEDKKSLDQKTVASLQVESDADKVAIESSSISGAKVTTIDIPAATTEKAGVMSADMFSSLSIDIDWIENVAIVENGRATTNNNFKSSDYLHIPFNVANISASGYIAGSAFLLAFYDAAKSFISGYGDFDDATATAHSCIHYSIPDNARYFRVCTSNKYEAFFFVWGDKKCNAKYDALLPLSVEWIDGEFVNRGGVISTNATWCRSDYSDVSDIAGITIKAYNRGTVLACAFYDTDYKYISGIGDYGYSVMTAIHINVAVPAEAKYMRVSTAVASKDDTVFLVNGMRDISQQEVNSLSANATADKVTIEGSSISGVKVTAADIPVATTERAGVMSAVMLNAIAVNAELIENIVIVSSGKQSTNQNYDATDYIEIPNGIMDVSAIGYIAGSAMLIAFYDASKTFINGYGNFGDATSKQYSAVHLEIPSNARYIRYSSNRAKDKTVVVWGNKSYNKGLGVLPFATQTIPAQFNRKQSGDSLRVLCFGSSWLTNTWWYLNKLTQAVGINATIKCYFSSACPFSKWVDRYEGKEETGTSTDFRRFDSVNGSDWSVEYVTDTTEFKHSLEGDWDVIVFQQGSSDSTNWDSDNGYANHYQKLMSYIKRSTKPWTVICYNNTWTPKLGAGSTRTKEAQQKWQELNNENCIKFTNAVGLSNFVIPCGAAVWALRNDSVITDADDFMKDDLHIKNGLPIYLTGLTLFRAVVTPFYGIDIDDIAWLPDESTQKNPASGSSWMSVDSEQGARVKQMVKLAFSNRYGFYTL